VAADIPAPYTRLTACIRVRLVYSFLSQTPIHVAIPRAAETRAEHERRDESGFSLVDSAVGLFVKEIVFSRINVVAPVGECTET
jgi:hypothetical protein